MKSKFAAFTLLLATVFITASCLGSDDNYTYTDDTAITSFSVTTAKQYKYVKTSDGLSDSLVVEELTLSSYKFYIDQLKGEVYNPDSLPCGVDAKKLLCSASGNSGVVLIKSMTSDSLSYFSSTDSLDFSGDRELQVVSNSGQALRKYKVHINVHKEQADSFVWHASAACEALKALNAVKVVAVGNGLLLFGSDGVKTLVFANTGNGWNACTPDVGHDLAAEAYNGVVVKDGHAYLSDGGNIVRSDNGTAWTTAGTATGITRLVAASRFRIYGYAADGRLMASADNGASWSVATIDDEQSLLPDGETAYACSAVDGYNLTDRVTLIGTRTSGNGDAPVIWGKIDEGADGSENQSWAYYPVSEDNTHALPALTCISAVPYDGALYVLGQTADGTVPAFYKSLDNGITWRADTATVVLPDNFSLGAAGGSAYAFTVDKNQSLWLVNAKSGMTWRGRINRLGWAEEQTAFEK